MRGTPAIYFKSLNRFFNIFGVEKQLFFIVFGLSSTLAFSARFSWVIDIVALGIFLVGHAAGVLITRVDNQMLALYRRHIRYAKYYAPVAGVNAQALMIKPSVPVYEGQKGLV